MSILSTIAIIDRLNNPNLTGLFTVSIQPRCLSATHSKNFNEDPPPAVFLPPQVQTPPETTQTQHQPNILKAVVRLITP